MIARAVSMREDAARQPDNVRIRTTPIVNHASGCRSNTETSADE